MNDRLKPNLRGCVWRAAVCLVCGVIVSSARADDADLSAREERAMRAAVERVAPSVVAIETVGGRQRAGQAIVGAGPTTGLIISPDGYIVSSAFDFSPKPASIVVRLPGGARLPARLVATDHNRMLVLLKVEAEDALPAPEAVPESEVQIGQWAIAVGRTFDGGQPNVSVGIVSALDRVWGKAVQTDAKISPNNYGGPLVDIRGRVLGVLAPLSPTKGAEATSVEWYDSGIGFAVPMGQIQQIFPRLKTGEDLKPGLMGVSLAGRDMYADAPIIASCRPNSPAYKAGIKAGDKIVQLAGRDIVRQSQMMYELNRRYAGDPVKVAVLRGEKRLEFDLELVDHLDPYQRPFFGILPRRGPVEAPDGVLVRYVYPDSPAAKAGVRPGDKLVAAAGKPVKHRYELVEIAAAIESGQNVAMEIVRGDERIKFDAVWSTEPETVPAELPPAVAEREAFADERPAVGSFSVKVPEFKNDALAYVPADYDPRLRYAVLTWFPSSGDFKDEDVLARWKAHCDRQGLILLAPKPAEQGKWQKGDLEFAAKALDQLRAVYQTDSLRVAAGGHELGGALAYALAFAHRDQLRGVAAVDAPLAEPPPENDPVYRLDFYVTRAKGSKSAPAIEAALKALGERKYAVCVRDQGEQGRELNDEELGELLRWLDTLDKF
ncbi:MAG TPA: PDZ domain-containing protein [Pirellulales bacterium]|nr:PDZ domain-containing protein [Pirellulales bacterium]